MYLHIGNGKSVKEKDVIGIFDLDNATISKITREMLTAKEKMGLVEYDYGDIPRSFVLTRKGNIILSRISAQGLKIRLNSAVNSEASDITQD